MDEVEVGRGGGVGRDRGVGVTLGVEVGVGDGAAAQKISIEFASIGGGT
jgi:hypothetical protein